MTLLLLALAALVASGLLAAALTPWPRAATAVGAAGVVAAAALALGPALSALAGAGALHARVAWSAPYGELSLGLDRLSAFFLVPLLAIAAAAAVYGRAYLLGSRQRLLGPPTLFFNLLVAAMVGVLLARDAVLLLVCWEVMSLTSFLLVTFEHEHAEVRRAGWVYLAAGEFGAVAFIAFLTILAGRAGGTGFEALAAAPAPGGALAAALAALALFACGLKAGLVPLHVWLPGAHAAAPSHMSALMSGVSLKIGLYGLLRVLGFLPPAGWWGPALIVLGLAGAAFGISQSIVQRDFKRALAYSSIENVGLVVLGLGLARWGTSLGSPAVAALGALAAGFHLWSHALLKSLLFLGAGSVLHGVGTRDLEALGGLAKRMPWTASALLFGAVALAGLPPLNGFVGEWLLMRGLFAASSAQGGAPGVAVLLGLGALALVGALASLSFVRLAGVALLGEPRSGAAARAHESPGGMLAPMGLLAGACAALSLWPPLALPPVAAFAAQVFGEPVGAGVSALAPSLRALGIAAAAIVAALALLGAALARRVRRPAPATPTWDCGYAAPDARMQYTAHSFSQLASASFLPAAAAPPVEEQRPRGLFPGPARFASNASDPVMRRWYEPLFTRIADRFAALRWLQQGLLHDYLLYILAVLVVALAWTSLRGGLR